MIFSTYSFLFAFLPLAYVGYLSLSKLASRVWAKLAIIVASFIFYWYGTGSFVLVFAALVLFNFGLGTKLGHLHEAALSVRARLLLFVGVAVDLTVLGYYKYYDFVVVNVNHFSSDRLALQHIVLPIGISFFTFQLVAYLVDSYRGDTAGYGLVDYLIFIAFFPQLVVGPIVHHKDVVPQFRDPSRASVHFGNISVGILLLTAGLAKKVLFADPLTDWAKVGFDGAGFANAGDAWLQAVSYSVSYYYDLSGYGDMAIGLGKLFNIELPWNFNSPFKARNFADYWRRWHMTLSKFLGDYVFRSLYRKGAGSRNFYTAIFVTFLVSGFWHGAGWNFVVWGIINGLFVMASHAMIRAKRSLPFLVAWLVTFLGVVLLRVMFVSPDLTFCLNTYQVMADLESLNIEKLVVKNATQGAWLAIALGAALWMPNTQTIMKRFKPNLGWGIVILCVLSICVLTMNQVSDFLYFQF